jgi:hypothetical protein
MYRGESLTCGLVWFGLVWFGVSVTTMKKFTGIGLESPNTQG